MSDLIKARDGVGYSGSVKISVKAGKTTISSKTIHNNGTVNLFKFLASCLKGEFEKNRLPCRIRLFRSDDNNIESASDDTKWKFDEAHAVSPYVYMTSSAVVYDNLDESKAQTKYVFRVPYGQISGKINKLALYAASTTSASDDRYAYIGLTKTNNESKQIEWDELEVKEDSKKYALEIEWTLEIKNQNTSNNSLETK
jgi:hypothetical protein